MLRRDEADDVRRAPPAALACTSASRVPPRYCPAVDPLDAAGLARHLAVHKLQACHANAMIMTGGQVGLINATRKALSKIARHYTKTRQHEGCCSTCLSLGFSSHSYFWLLFLPTSISTRIGKLLEKLISGIMIKYTKELAIHKHGRVSLPLNLANPLRP